MGVIETKNRLSFGGVKRNSYYYVRNPYSQREKDDYRISAGYSKETKDYTKKQN